MSNWVLAEDYDRQNAPPQASKKSQWVVEEPQETFGEALKQAPGRIATDIGQGLHGFINSLPNYWQSAKTEIPGAAKTLFTDPAHAGAQGLAGFAQLGQGIIDTPQNISNYFSQRLHLVPEDVNKKFQAMHLPLPGAEESINDVLGRANRPGDELLRGLGRNVENILPVAAGVRAFNPLRYTNKGVTKNILKTGAEQESTHSGMYEDIFNQGRNAGLNRVPFQRFPFMVDLRTISKYQTPLKYKSSVDFYRRPTLQNAQRAKSDLDSMARTIQDTERTRPLTGEERNLYNSVVRNRDQIVNSMFKDQRGNLNEKLNQRYRDINKSYAENVVPYKYNSDIQAFKNREITAKKLVERLRSGGEFEVKKGKEHPELYRNERLRKAMLALHSGALAGAGFGGGYGLYKYLSAKPTE